MNDENDSNTIASLSRNKWLFSVLTLPMGGGPVSENSTSSGPATLSKQKTVLVVDDDPGMLRGVKRLLSAHGYDSLLFSSAEALHKHENFDQALCVVLDINLRDDSGIDVNHRLKAAGVSAPVIFITGNDNPATRMAAMASGCLAYLTKPFVAASLIEPIKRLAAGLT